MSLVTKNAVIKLIAALAFTTCQVCMSKFRIIEGSTNKSTSSAGSDTKSDTSGNKKTNKKYYWKTSSSCQQVNGDEAKTICKAKGCDKPYTIAKACQKITCYKCQKNSQCTNNGCK